MIDFIKRLKFILETKLFSIGQTEITPLVLFEFVLLIIIFSVLSKILRKLIRKRILTRLKLADGTQFAILRLSHFTIMFIGILIAFNSIGINFTSLTVTFGVLGVGIAFGLQNITSNFISGIILLFERHVNVGDYVTVQDTSSEIVIGQVKSINIRATKIVTIDNVTLIVPNSQFIQNTVTNWSVSDPKIRISINVGVAYGSNTELVTKLLLKAAEDHEYILKEPAPIVIFQNFGESSLNFRLSVWIQHPIYRIKVTSDLHYAIDNLFRENGITIPFPQRDVHIY
ncbi:MAG: mechanosensitive ion channel family protein [bacterium]